MYTQIELSGARPMKKGFRNNYGWLIDFLSQISKLYYFTFLDLADVLMHH